MLLLLLAQYGFEPGVDFMRALGSSTMGKPGGIRMETLKDGEVVLSLDSVASRSPSGPLIAARMGSGIDADNAANAGRLLETSRQPQPHGEALKGRGVQKVPLFLGGGVSPLRAWNLQSEECGVMKPAHIGGDPSSTIRGSTLRPASCMHLSSFKAHVPPHDGECCHATSMSCLLINCPSLARRPADS